MRREKGDGSRNAGKRSRGKWMNSVKVYLREKALRWRMNEWLGEECSGRFRGGTGGPGPPLGKPKNVKRPHLRKIPGTTPPPLNHVGFWRSRENSATTPPTESR